MHTSRLSLRCPTCGSRDVFYSCTPNCCFNHVCNDCRTTFEPVTRALGGRLAGIVPPDPPPDSTGPTAACARCESTAVYLLEDGRLVCGKCESLLELELTGIASDPGT